MGRRRGKAKGMSRIRSHQLMDLAAMAALAAEATEQHEAMYAEDQLKLPPQAAEAFAMPTTLTGPEAAAAGAPVIVT
jgi:alcohol dehydrogenase class IV